MPNVQHIVVIGQMYPTNPTETNHCGCSKAGKRLRLELNVTKAISKLYLFLIRIATQTNPTQENH